MKKNILKFLIYRNEKDKEVPVQSFHLVRAQKTFLKEKFPALEQNPFLVQPQKTAWNHRIYLRLQRLEDPNEYISRNKIWIQTGGDDEAMEDTQGEVIFEPWAEETIELTSTPGICSYNLT